MYEIACSAACLTCEGLKLLRECLVFYCHVAGFWTKMAGAEQIVYGNPYEPARTYRVD